MDILKTIEELKISVSNFIEKCHVPEQEAIRIIYSNDADSKLDLYWQFVTTLNDESLRPELIKFLSPYAEDNDQLIYIVEKSLNNRSNPNARRMLNSIKRLVSIADDMEKIRPGKDVLKLFFFVVCIESLYSLASTSMSKVEIVKDFFNQYINYNDQNKILEKSSEAWRIIS